MEHQNPETDATKQPRKRSSSFTTSSDNIAKDEKIAQNMVNKMLSEIKSNTPLLEVHHNTHHHHHHSHPHHAHHHSEHSVLVHAESTDHVTRKHHEPSFLRNSLESAPMSRSSSGESATNTISHDITSNFNKKVNTISINAKGRFAALGGKQLYFIDLDVPEKEISLKINPHQNYEIGVVEWHHHIEHPYKLAYGVHNEVFIVNLESHMSKSENLAKLHLHKRTVTGLSWSTQDANLLATCAADGFSYIWDIRDPSKPAKLMKSFNISPTLVEFNRCNDFNIATSHSGEARIWDLRNPIMPVSSITAHVSPITSIDWSRTHESSLLTASQDKHIKLWNTNDNKSALQTIIAGAPIVRARFTPFGRGVVAATKLISDFAIKMWNLHDPSLPCHSFTGHTDEIVSFDWRIHTSPNKAYQLVSLGRDQHLKMFAISKNLIKSCKNKTTTTKPSATSDIYPLDLAQEFAHIRKHGIPGVQIEEMDLANRFIIVTVERQNQTADIKITFPELYPHNAVPSFEFLVSSSVAVTVQANLRKFLTETAQNYVEQNKPCLETCLSKLVLLLKHVNISKLEKEHTGSPGELPSASLTEQWMKINSGKITSGDSPTSVRNEDVTYQVKPTDTLMGIALLHNVKPDQLKQLNGLHNDQLIPGQKSTGFDFVKQKPPRTRAVTLQFDPSIKGRLSQSDRANVHVTETKDSGLLRSSIEEKPSNPRSLVENDSVIVDDSRINTSSQETPRTRSSTGNEKSKERPRLSLMVSQPAPKKDLLKEQARYCSESFHVSGMLTITEDFLFFEPNFDDPFVQKNGILPYQLHVAMRDIFDVQIVKDNPKFYYENSLEVSCVKDASITVHNFLFPEIKLRTVYKKIMAWTSNHPHTPGSASNSEKEEESSAPQSLTSSRDDEPESVEFTPKFSQPSLLLTNAEHLKMIVRYLPKRYWLNDWVLLYGTQTHGVSLNTFYSKCQDAGPTILVVEDSNGFVFGGFSSESWRIEPLFYGNGESFLFTLKPKPNFFRWSQKNNNFQCSRRDFIAIGGGSHFGLWLDSDFERGSSGDCETFANPCLASSEDFKITVVEVWGFQ